MLEIMDITDMLPDPPVLLASGAKTMSGELAGQAVNVAADLAADALGTARDIKEQVSEQMTGAAAQEALKGIAGDVAGKAGEEAVVRAGQFAGHTATQAVVTTNRTANILGVSTWVVVAGALLIAVIVARITKKVFHSILSFVTVTVVGILVKYFLGI